MVSDISPIIESTNWPAPCKENMLKLKMSSKHNALKLAATAYSCIEKQYLADMIGWC